MIINKTIQKPYIVTKEYMDDYIRDIECRVLQGRLPPQEMRIVERYKKYKQYERLGKIDFNKLMKYLTEWIPVLWKEINYESWR